MKKVLLLNPPGKELYIRDYYCSKTSQAAYIYHPLDLVVISGYLRDKFEVKLIDCIVDKIEPEKCFKTISEFSPDVIIFLTGYISWYEDIQFLKKIYEFKKEIKFIGSGDILREDWSDRFKEAEFLSGIILDFTNEDVIKIIEEKYDNLENSVIKKNSNIIPKISPSPSKEYQFPIPQHELFVYKNYRYPFIRSRRFATTITEYGCPFKCSFCVISTLEYKKRTIKNIVQEIKYIKNLGISEIFFATQTFGINKTYAKELCKELIPLKIKWLTFSRVDVVDEELLKLMKLSGCHTIIFGVESGSESLLKKYKKGYTKEQIKNTLYLCRKIGIDTVGTFILGLPEETKETIEETIELLKELPLDYASFNVAVPRYGTELRKEAISSGLITQNTVVMDQSKVCFDTKYLSRDEVLKYRQKAVKTFYFNFRYIWQRIKKIKSFYSLINQVKQCFALIQNVYG